MKSTLIAAATFAVLTGAGLTTAQEVRYYKEDGTTYRETRQKIRRPVSETRMEPRQRIVQRERVTTDWRDTYQTHMTPVTEYRWESRWVGRWNPLQTPYLVHEIVPRTRWEWRTDKVTVPLTRREFIPETEVVQVPVTTLRMADEEVITRMAVSGSPSGDPFASGSSRMANRSAIGGIGRLQNDPPRQSSDATWRPSSGSTVTIRR